MKFELHQHQRDALAMLRSSLQAGRKRPMVQAPTGFGKTLLAAAIVEGALSKGKRVIFTVPFISLIDQTVEAFEEQGIRDIGVIQGLHERTDPTMPVQVASIQTLVRRPVPPADIVVVDEAHRWFEFFGQWMTSPNWQRVPFVGLSATPWAKGLGKFYDDLLIAARTSDLIERGFLSKFQVFAPSHPDLSKVRTVAGDYHEGDLANVMSDPTLVGDVVTTWLRQGEERPTLCFAVDRAHARKLADEFETAGVPCGYVDANTPMDERLRVGQRLAQGQIRVVCNVGCLTTGVDWDIRCIILARPTKSEILFTQIIGRGLRTAKEKGKENCLILDHSDTTLRLGFVTDIHHDTLDDGKPRKSSASGRDKPTPLPKECPKCTALKPAGVRVCPACGFVPERQSPIEARDGELVQLNGKKKRRGEPTPHSPQEVFSMLLWHADRKGYRPGFATMKFIERYGVPPNGLERKPQEPDAAFSNWMLSLQIRYARSKARAPQATTMEARLDL